MPRQFAVHLSDRGRWVLEADDSLDARGQVEALLRERNQLHTYVVAVVEVVPQPVRPAKMRDEPGT